MSILLRNLSHSSLPHPESFCHWLDEETGQSHRASFVLRSSLMLKSTPVTTPFLPLCRLAVSLLWSLKPIHLSPVLIINKWSKHWVNWSFTSQKRRLLKIHMWFTYTQLTVEKHGLNCGMGWGPLLRGFFSVDTYKYYKCIFSLWCPQ